MGFPQINRIVPKRGAVNAAAVLDVLAIAAKSEPAKVVARKTGISARHVRNIANGNTDTAITTALAFAAHYPQVRQFFASVLALETLDPRTEALLKSMREWQAAQPEEGDRNNE